MAFSLLGLAWIAIEFAPPNMGYADVDSPAVMLRYLADHPEIPATAVLVLFAMSITLLAGAFSIADRLAVSGGTIAVRVVTTIGLVAAVSYFGLAVVRASGGPLMYVNGLNAAWGEAGFVTMLMLGTHGFEESAVTAAAMWAAGVSLLGARSQAIPLPVCLLGVVPAVRLVTILGPLHLLPEEAWLLTVVSIPAFFLWTLALGVALVRQEARPSLGERPVSVGLTTQTTG
ncbi:MAG TPA: hypothetical protein VM347_22185 [Nonomuraea sp.]|nr:hypothetical protein [Nonomuraea sp.]